MKYFKHQMILNLLFKDRIYSATNKGWDFNVDLKLFKYDGIKINFYNLFLICQRKKIKCTASLATEL